MDGRLGCININGHATSHVHISCQGQYGKIWTNEVIQKEKESVLPFKNFEMTIMHGKKVRYSESRIAHFHGVAMSKRGKRLYRLNLYNNK